MRFCRDDVFAHQTFILDEIRAEKLSESSRRRRRGGFPIAVLFQRFTHNARFRNVIDELFVVDFSSFRVEHIEKSIGNGAYSFVHLLQRLPFQKRRAPGIFKQFGLEHLDQLQLASSFQLEPF